MSGYRAFVLALGVVAALGVVMVATEAANWPGDASGCVAQDDCYCERFRRGGFATQPVNTASNLGFVVVGLGILWRLGRRRRPLATAFGLVAVGLGVGSALFHGTITSWGGWADLVSMYAFITLYIAINIAFWRRWPDRLTLATFGVSAVILAALQVPLEQGAGKYVFGVLVGAALLTEVAVRDAPRSRRWLLAAAGVFMASFVVWNLSRTGAAWCAPDSALQGHALWHLGSAATVALLYQYLHPALVKQ